MCSSDLGMEIDLERGKDGVNRMKEIPTVGYDLYSNSIKEDTRGGLIDIIA